VLQALNASDFVVKLRVNHQMEVIVNLLNLRQILVLHFASRHTLFATLIRIGEENLIYDDVVNVDFLFGQFNGKSFRLVHGEELGDANGHKSSL